MTRLAILRPVSGLSARQERILWALHDLENVLGYWPSIREVMQQTETKSTSVVHYNLQRLEERGLMDLGDGAYRTAHPSRHVAFARVNGERRIYEAVS